LSDNLSGDLYQSHCEPDALFLTTSCYFSDCNSIESDPYFRRKSFFK